MDFFEDMVTELYGMRGSHRKGEDHPEFFELLAHETLGFDPKENVVVVGTNGKGTTAQLIFHLLRAQGYRVGLFTSPHLVHIKERFRYQDRFITESELLNLREQIKAKHTEISLSFFEVLTLMAVQWFSDLRNGAEGLDFVVWEAGLGGRFDPAANIPHDLTVLTTISLDHEELLGGNLNSIAWHKLGAISSGGYLLSAPPDVRWESAMKTELKKKNAQWIPSDSPKLALSSKILNSPEGSLVKTVLGEVKIQLLGEMAMKNLNLALHALKHIHGLEFLDLKPLESVVFWGRGQWIRDKFKVPVLLSGDHNAEGWQHLVNSLTEQLSPDVQGVLFYRLSKESKSLEFHKNILKLGNFRSVQSHASDPSSLKNELESVLAETPKESFLILTGSLYFIGDCMVAMGISPTP